MKLWKYGCLLMLLMVPTWALAEPNVQVKILAEKVFVLDKDGRKVEERKPATDVVPGDVLVYTLMFENKGNEAATDVVLNDPIPTGTTYIADSVFGPGAEASFSVDGKHFKKASLLTYTIEQKGKKETRKASPEEYTHIRWVISSIPADKSGMVGFRVRVK